MGYRLEFDRYLFIWVCDVFHNSGTEPLITVYAFSKTNVLKKAKTRIDAFSKKKNILYYIPGESNDLD